MLAILFCLFFDMTMIARSATSFQFSVGHFEPYSSQRTSADGTTCFYTYVRACGTSNRRPCTFCMHSDNDDEGLGISDARIRGLGSGNEVGNLYSSKSSVQQQSGARKEDTPRGSNRWVVIVDDEESIRNAVGKYLIDRGYRVSAYADAKTALNECRIARAAMTTKGRPSGPDVIVSDVRMPGMDGLEFLNEIRNDKNLVGMPVVLLTAKGMTEDRIAGFKAGADAYLPKPFDPEELIAIIENSISRHETLSRKTVKVDDLKRDLDEIKVLLLERGGAGPGNGWVTQNVFLTPDERNVLELLCRGLVNREIAEQAHLSVRRVEQQLTSMYNKTKSSNRTELVRWAMSTGNVEI